MMGRSRPQTRETGQGNQPVVRKLARALAALTLAALVPLPLVSMSPVLAQAAPAAANAVGGVAKAKPKDRLLVEAKELVYDKTNNKVSAVGNVQLYYQGRVLEADRVTYDRKTNRVHAEGNAKLTDENNNVTYADRFELTDNFKDGFIDSLTLVTADQTRFTASRAERVDGKIATLEKGTYTACLPCKDNPEKPPFWQIKAARIIENTEEHVVYFEDATFELFGMPIAWLPYFSAPDATVTRKTGFLTPGFIYRKSLGFGASVPFFWNLAPNYDLTLTPTLLSRQGFLAELEWRHRLANGAYSIRASGLHQADPSAFLDPPFGAGARTWRGSVETQGKFYISDKWSFGWNASAFSDRYYLSDYKLKNQNVTQNYFKESISTAYLGGQGANGFFDLRGYYIQGLSNHDLQTQQPIVHPVFDYNKLIEIPKERSLGIGGDVIIDANLTSLSRRQAAFQSIGTRALDQAFGLYDVCETRVPDPANVGKFVIQRTYNPGSCFLRGIGGAYTRATVQAAWQRKFIDPIGQVWTPFVFLRADASRTDLNLTRQTAFSSPAGASFLSNADQANFFGGDRISSQGNVMPGIGLEYRYPLIAQSAWGNQVFEPIVQAIVRPSERRKGSTPNEDAQSLVFDASNLFAWDKFSGYDRTEGGTRLNIGAQYTLTLNSGGYINAMAGQSIQLAGRNSYAAGDVANIGIGSGLDKKLSDYVGRITIAPNSTFSLVANARFDQSTYAAKRLDITASARFDRLSADIVYARFAAQPEIGFPKRREAIFTNAKFNVTRNVYVNGTVMFDMARFQYDVPPQKTPRFSPNLYGFGIGYKDECTTLGVNYLSYLNDSSAGDRTRNQTVMFTLQLRTLGDIKGSTSVGATSPTASDGLLSQVVQP